jgi:hypothetical protein
MKLKNHSIYNWFFQIVVCLVSYQDNLKIARVETSISILVFEPLTILSSVIIEFAPFK